MYQAIGDKWLVKNGLEAGERVIVEGLQKIRVGEPAQVTPADVAAR
jgi:membrane fusion protein (multidrug efflux system)